MLDIIQDSPVNIATLTVLLREAEARHGAYEAKAPKHHWVCWYAAYIDAREHGHTTAEAADIAVLHVQRNADGRCERP
jgi:hypothetical protein